MTDRTLDYITLMRLRPNMFIGDEDQRSVNMLIQGVVEELFKHDGRSFEIALHVDNFTTITGNDSGILAEDIVVAGKNMSRVECAMTVGLSGTGWGVGIDIANGYSEQLEVKICRNGSAWEQSYRRGIPQCRLHKTGMTNNQGTSIRFLPDKEFFALSELHVDGLIEHLRGRIEWYEERTGNPPEGWYEKSAFKKAALYREARFSITDEREIDPQTGKPRHTEF